MPWPGPGWSLGWEVARSQGDLNCGLALATKGICIRQWVKCLVIPLTYVATTDCRRGKGALETHRVAEAEIADLQQDWGFQGAWQPVQELQGVAFGWRGVGEAGLHRRPPVPSLKAGDTAGSKIEAHP